MRVTVLLPDFNGSQEVILSRWLKSVGDRVEVGEDIVKVELVMPARPPSIWESWEYEQRRPYLAAFHYGTLTEIFVAEGQRVEPGQAIARLTPWPCPTPTSTTLVEMRNILKDSPPEKKVRVGDVLHFIGWLTVVILLWRVWGWVNGIVVDTSPLWLQWLIELPVAVVLLGITAFLLIHGLVQM